MDEELRPADPHRLCKVKFAPIREVSLSTIIPGISAAIILTFMGGVTIRGEVPN